ncbi:LysR family transcriptional regulator [Dasania sp. GY-MA-18]|uniref:LysR family transcriptional regulator n=1 Tax=Dasania phycosphaerae TaxID=2950436 RepID=A0A9J6RKK3_9GAMM|nr:MULTISPECIES: LysR family transcriptional regulator [Dasania]MCR8922808.1 LysR family transcriptional regulator [Dasania sp. GY-MA-18]MCZ0865238.1 LysR family transcriptional regulator [Dasania phycosphaerae]MCZ0868964.1 LysR family transcriptional regulator [Dasania phycosphaerae]
MTPDSLERHFVSRLKIKHLRLLVTVGEQKNIFKAAQIMNMAQPAATKTIRNIETALDMSLFDRSSRGVSPTPYGEVIIKHAKLILSQIKHVSEELISIQDGISGKVSIGTLLAASPTLLPKSLATLKQERGNISVSVIEGTNDMLLPSLEMGDIDIVVGRLPEIQENESLKSEVLYYEPIAIVARKNHPLSKKDKLSLKDLVNEQWILPSEGTTLRREIDNAFHKEGLNVPQSCIECVSILTNRTLLLETDMVAAMPYQVIRSYEDMGLLTQLPIKIQAALGPVGYTVRANTELTPAANYFLSILKDTAKTLESDKNITH